MKASVALTTAVSALALAVGGAALATTYAVNGSAVVGPHPVQLATRTTATQTPVEYGGAIRCTNGVWAAISDAGHLPEGILSVTATSSYVQVNHVHVDQVRTAIYGWDNDYPLNGIVVTGASGGLDFDRVWFMKNGSAINPAEACGVPYGNVWLAGKGWVTTP